ncbi:MAG: energy-coupling factor ABC transporter permease [Kiritimatiellae bacterium]|nr:energy-coupling factor ABC transporter permease [Kiritimatiellia bacterium]
MHMADALVSPAVGGTLWAASAALTFYSARAVRRQAREALIPLMGVMGAFVFAAQMINVAIPGTGSSGHLGGGLMLAILLGPQAAFLVMASILAVQALFFADGGLLALGCNIFNLGFFGAFVAYPLVYRPVAGDGASATRCSLAAMLASIVALQLGALGVVIETVASGITELRFSTFALLMQPIHLAIGVMEGLATAAVIAFVRRARPEVLHVGPWPASRGSNRLLFGGLLAATLLVGGVLSWFASSHPDGLEWSIFKLTGGEELALPEDSLHQQLASLQERSAVLPDYSFKSAEAEAEADEAQAWPAVSAGTTVSGMVGGALTLCLACAIGFILRWQGSSRRAAG